MSNLFYYSYYGNKRTEIKHFSDVITKLIAKKEINTIVEPFCGSCALSLDLFVKKALKTLTYHMNDRDDHLISFFYDVKDNTCKKYIDYCNDYNKEFTCEKWKAQIKKYHKEPYEPLNYFYFHAFEYESRDPKFYDEKPSIRKTLKFENYKDTDEFFKKATLTCQDFRLIFEKYKDNANALLFLDPPYLDSCNKSYIGFEVVQDETGRLIDNTKIYIDILNFFKEAKCKIIMILNDNAIIRHLYGPWIKRSYGKTYMSGSSGKGKHKRNTDHLIISNIK